MSALPSNSRSNPIRSTAHAVPRPAARHAAQRRARRHVLSTCRGLRRAGGSRNSVPRRAPGGRGEVLHCASRRSPESDRARAGASPPSFVKRARFIVCTRTRMLRVFAMRPIGKIQNRRFRLAAEINADDVADDAKTLR